MKAATATPAPSRSNGKLFYRINEVAKMTGLKPYVLRYWEGEFPELSPAKDGSDQRRYRQSDIDIVLSIRKLLYEDRFTIEGARKRLREELRGKARTPQADGAVPPPAKAKPEAAPQFASHGVVERLDQTLGRLRKEVNELLSLLS